MSSNERDTQFAEWASLLLNELMSYNRVYTNIANGYWYDESREIIARRVYDLAQFIVSQAFEDELKPQEIFHKNGKPVLMYPDDLAEWYEEKS